jgi:peptide/nickel transport system substrate-binding protein
VIDEPGPWGTGPFILKHGYSSIFNIQSVIIKQPYHSTWLTVNEIRTPSVVLDANEKYWDKSRMPKVKQIIFRNDLTKMEALKLCMYSEGKVDIVTEVPAKDAFNVITSPYAKLVSVPGNKVLAGVFNKFQSDVDFNDLRLRLSLNLSLNQKEVVERAFNGYAGVVPALTPPWAFDFPAELKPISYDPDRARNLFKEINWPKERPLRIAAPEQYKDVSEIMAAQLTKTLEIVVEVITLTPIEELKWRRVLAEKRLIPNWDIFLDSPSALFLEGTPAFFHREFFGIDGALRAGPESSEFDTLYQAMAEETDRLKMLESAKEIDRFVYREALALFICAPYNLYAVNKHVDFKPYRTTFELTDTEVNNHHWSRRLE